ncbi:MAG: hypothetical protein R3D80_02785 [Paracoccaceae bacterium]
MSGDLGIGDQTWTDVLQAMDRTYAELVDYQEQLEARNAELTNLRHFLASIMTSISDYLIVADRDRKDRRCQPVVPRRVRARHRRSRAATSATSLRRHRRTWRDLRRAGTSARCADLGRAGDARGRDPVERGSRRGWFRRGKATGVVLTGRPMGELLRAYSGTEVSHRELKETQGQARAQREDGLARPVARGRGA